MSTDGPEQQDKGVIQIISDNIWFATLSNTHAWPTVGRQFIETLVALMTPQEPLPRNGSGTFDGSEHRQHFTFRTESPMLRPISPEYPSRSPSPRPVPRSS